MKLKDRAIAGVFGGVAATLILSGLREAWTRSGLVFKTAPMQVVDRMQELGPDLATEPLHIPVPSAN